MESMSTLAAWLNEQGFHTKSKKPQVIMGETVEGEGRHQADQRGVVRGGAGADGEEPSRRSVSSNVKSEHPHLLTKLFAVPRVWD